MSCARIKSAVSGYEKELSPRIKVRTVECDSAEGVEAARRYDFRSHGLVIHDRKGELIFKRRDHMVRAEDVYAVLRQYLGLPNVSGATSPPPKTL